MRENLFTLKAVLLYLAYKYYITSIPVSGKLGGAEVETDRLC